MDSMPPIDVHSREERANRPVLAILTMDADNMLFRGNRSNFADLIVTGQSMGFIVYVLTVKQLVLSRSSLKGFVYNRETSTWHQRLLPFPNIIYNRIPTREDELQPSVQLKLAACKKNPRIMLFNSSFFNKWELFEWLRQSKLTKRYIPMTRKLETINGLVRMMRRHSFLYLKPEDGKAGKGIMTIMVMPEKQLPYRLKIQENKKSSTYNCSSVTKLWNRVQRQSSDGAYIAQQGIKLAAFNDRNFDLRVLVQKNNRGQWDVTGIGARLAGISSITTHVPRGGMIEDPLKLLASSFDELQARKLLVKAKNTAILIAKQIERASGQTLGEMSMDLGVDNKGDIWFFEANSKPMKFDEPHIRIKSLEQIFQFANYLTKRKLDNAGGA